MSTSSVVRLTQRLVAHINISASNSLQLQQRQLTATDIGKICNVRHVSTGKAPVRLIGLGQGKLDGHLVAVARKNKNNGPRKPRSKIRSLSRADIIDPDTTDWSSVYDAAQSYNPSVIPLPIRMGRPRPNKIGDVPPNDKGNIELLKIPNFFHLTPPAIQKHCEVLKEYCVPWPDTVSKRAIRVTTINFLYSGPSIRHPDSRKVKLQIYLKDLDLDAHARQKFKLLVGDRYNPSNDELTIISDRCPTRKQNKDYAYYLLTALYHESWKVEDWEEEAGDKSYEELKNEIESVNRELDPSLEALKTATTRRRYRIVNEKLVRYNNKGHAFVMEQHKYHIKGGLNEEERRQANDEWQLIKKDLPDEESFDPIYRRNSESEFSN